MVSTNEAWFANESSSLNRFLDCMEGGFDVCHSLGKEPFELRCFVFGDREVGMLWRPQDQHLTQEGVVLNLRARNRRGESVLNSQNASRIARFPKEHSVASPYLACVLSGRPSELIEDAESSSQIEVVGIRLKKPGSAQAWYGFIPARSPDGERVEQRLRHCWIPVQSFDVHKSKLWRQLIYRVDQEPSLENLVCRITASGFAHNLVRSEFGPWTLDAFTSFGGRGLNDMHTVSDLACWDWISDMRFINKPPISPGNIS
jgi:hypothetical protein